MATITAAAGGGGFNEGATWEGGVAPTEADDAILGAGSGSVTIGATAKCRSLDALNYKKTLTFSAGGELKVGDEAGKTSNAGLCLRFGSGMTRVGSEKIRFVSTSTEVEKITANGISLGRMTFGEPGSAKWEFQDNCVTGAIEQRGGELKTGGRTVEATSWEVFNATLALGASTIKLTSTGIVWNVEAGATLSATESTIEVTNASASAKKWEGGGKSYGTLTIASDNVTIIGGNTYVNIAVNTRGKSTKGTSFPKSVVTTVTGTFSTNATQTEKVLLTSNIKGKSWKLSVASGEVLISFVEIEDGIAEGGATFRDHWGRNLGNSSGWLFDEEPYILPTPNWPPNLMRSPSGKTLALIDPFPPLFPAGASRATYEAELVVSTGASCSTEAQRVKQATSAIQTGAAISETARKIATATESLTAGARASITSIKVGIATSTMRTGASLTDTSQRIRLGEVQVRTGALSTLTAIKVATGSFASRTGAACSTTSKPVFTERLTLAGGARCTTISQRETQGVCTISTGTRCVPSAVKVATAASACETGSRLAATAQRACTGTSVIGAGALLYTVVAARQVLATVSLRAGVRLTASTHLTLEATASLRAGTRVSSKGVKSVQAQVSLQDGATLSTSSTRSTQGTVALRAGAGILTQSASQRATSVVMRAGARMQKQSLVIFTALPVASAGGALLNVSHIEVHADPILYAGTRLRILVGPDFAEASSVVLSTNLATTTWTSDSAAAILTSMGASTEIEADDAEGTLTASEAGTIIDD